MPRPQTRPHDTFVDFLDCVATLAGREKLELMSRGPDAGTLWMLGGLPSFRELRTNIGIEALRKVWDDLPKLKKKGKGAIQKVLAVDWSGSFPEDNSAIIAGGIWFCLLLHGDRRAQKSDVQRQKLPDDGRAHEKKAQALTRPKRRASKKKSERENDRKGDSSLLTGKDRVSFRTAEQYLGITERHRQNLIKAGSLIVEGKGQNRQITTESLKRYVPPSENTK
jgi:hypothetical protein